MLPVKEKIFLLDNNDSFTYNIVDYLRRMDNIRFTVQSASETHPGDIKAFDKIIISPGPGLPKDFPVIFQILEKFYFSKPVLGICLGCQAIGHFFGADLINLRPVIHGQAHVISVTQKTPIFRDLPSSFKVGLYHSWALNPQSIPDQVDINAISETGTIMAISSNEYSIYGIQFHPESYITEYGYQMLVNFAEL